MDKQKEIEKMACDMCLWRHGCNDPNNPIDSCVPLRMAERAVEAGYGDVKEVQHRAEVAEKAGRIIQRDMARVFDISNPRVCELIANIWDLAKKQAEKELAEERKDE